MIEVTGGERGLGEVGVTQKSPLRVTGLSIFQRARANSGAEIAPPAVDARVRGGFRRT